MTPIEQQALAHGLEMIENAGNILAAGSGCKKSSARCGCPLHAELTEFMLAVGKGAAIIRSALEITEKKP